MIAKALNWTAWVGDYACFADDGSMGFWYAGTVGVDALYGDLPVQVGSGLGDA